MFIGVLFILMLSLHAIGAFHCELQLSQRSAIETDIVFEIDKDHGPLMDRELVVGIKQLPMERKFHQVRIPVDEHHDIFVNHVFDPEDAEAPFKIQVQFRSKFDPEYNVISPLIHPATFSAPHKRTVQFSFPKNLSPKLMNFIDTFHDLPGHTFVYGQSFRESALNFDERTQPHTHENFPAIVGYWDPIEQKEFCEATTVPFTSFDAYLKELDHQGLRFWFGSGEILGTSADSSMVFYEVNKLGITYTYAFMLGAINIGEAIQDLEEGKTEAQKEKK